MCNYVWNQTRLNVGNVRSSLIISKSPENSETKNRGVSVEHRGVCEILGCDQSMKTQNLKTKNRGSSIGHRGVCVECSDVINL